MNTEKNCKATLYSESPHFLIPKALKNLVMPREDSMAQYVGHVFMSITDENGKESVYGLHTAAAAQENTDKPFKDRKPMIIGKTVPGYIADDSKEPHDDKMVYKITREQYDTIKNYVEEQKKNPPKYDLFSSNCVTFAYKALHKGGLKLPPQPILHNPMTVTISIRALEAIRETKKALKISTAKILSGFSATKKLSEKLLNGAKKVYDMNPFGIKTISESLRAGMKNKMLSLKPKGR